MFHYCLFFFILLSTGYNHSSCQTIQRSIIYAIPSMSSLSFLALRKKHEVVQSEKLLKLNPSADTNIIELTWMQKGKTIRVLHNTSCSRNKKGLCSC